MAHLINASYNILGAGGAPNALSEISGHPEDKWGGAVMAALQIKDLPTGPRRRLQGRRLLRQGCDQAGDLHERWLAELRDVRWYTIVRALTRASASARRLMRFTARVSRLRAGEIKLVDLWGIRGAFNHNWDPYWSSSLFGSYAQVRYGGVQ